MAMSQSSLHINNSKQRIAAKQLSARVVKCWELEFNWDHVPQKLKEVSIYRSTLMLPQLCMYKGKSAWTNKPETQVGQSKLGKRQTTLLGLVAPR